MQDTIDPLQPPNKNNRILLMASLVIFVLVVGVIAFMAYKYQSKNNQSGQAANTGNPAENPADKNQTVKQNFQVASKPTLDFSTWNMQNQPVTSPTSPTVYYFKQAYSFGDAQTLAQKLNSSGTLKSNNNLVIAYSNNLNTSKDLSMMAFNTTNGSFSYSSTNGVPVRSPVNNESIYEFLQNLNVYDPTLRVSATYKKKSEPGTTFYELHRDWRAAGYPILNSIGLLNIPEKQSLSTLSLDAKLDSLLPNDDIISASDGKNGFERQSDFNTMTVAVSDKTASVTSLKSNMRLVESTGQMSSVVSYADAVEKLKNGKYEFILTTPSGTGDTPWEKIYPNNIAQADNVVVTESVIAYLEDPPAITQTSLIPSYIFKGYANLKSGYRINIIAAVSLSPDAQPQAKQPSFQFVKDAFAQQTPSNDKGQKQSTFDVTQLNSGSSQGNGAPVVTLDPSMSGTGNQNVCRPSTLELNPIYQISGLKFGWANWRVWQGKRSTNRNGFWYYIPEASVSDNVLRSNLSSIVSQLESLSGGNNGASSVPSPTTAPTDNGSVQSPTNDTTQKQSTFNVTPPPITAPAQNITAEELRIRQQNKIIQDILSIPEQCPVRLTGASPSLFIYGPEGTAYTIHSLAKLTYADPVTENDGAWNVTVAKDGVLVNGFNRPYIYYEYAPAAFTKPAKGWVISKDSIRNLAGTIAKQLSLTEAETKRLVFELNHAANSVTSETIFVGLLDQQQVDGQVPLNVSPRPAAVIRLHFYVSSATKADHIQAPQLHPIQRGESLMIELGSHTQK